MKLLTVIFSFLLIVSILVQCQTKVKPKYFMHEDLTKIWETTPELLTSESVCYNPDKDILYVSCVNGQPTEKDSNGYIAQVGLDGKIVNLKWIKSLDAPKGMGIFEGKLYVTDIDRIVEIDIDQGQIIQDYPVEGAKFLNDISIDDSGRVYFSDTNTKKIHRLSNNIVETWLESDSLVSVNGLFVEDGSILIGTASAMLKANLQTKVFQTFIINEGGIDGLKPEGNGDYLFSDWVGHVYRGYPGMERTLLLDTTPVKANAADIEFIISKKLLLVPTFSDNRVVAYKINSQK
jgi:hypothetical protein